MGTITRHLQENSRPLCPFQFPTYLHCISTLSPVQFLTPLPPNARSSVHMSTHPFHMVYRHIPILRSSRCWVGHSLTRCRHLFPGIDDHKYHTDQKAKPSRQTISRGIEKVLFNSYRGTTKSPSQYKRAYYFRSLLTECSQNPL